MSALQENQLLYANVYVLEVINLNLLTGSYYPIYKLDRGWSVMNILVIEKWNSLIILENIILNPGKSFIELCLK